MIRNLVVLAIFCAATAAMYVLGGARLRRFLELEAVLVVNLVLLSVFISSCLDVVGTWVRGVAVSVLEFYFAEKKSFLESLGDGSGSVQNRPTKSSRTSSYN